MFSAEFYPTPRAIARRMLAKITNKDAKYYLEPSAGKGDICDVIRRPYTDDEFEEEFPSKNSDQRENRRYARYRQEDRKVDIDVIEAHPDLVTVLRHKNLTVVGYDWLSYDGVSYYDAILMNPPFSEGARHLLKAWSFIHNGEIVCLLNQETIDNPYTEERQQLVAIIKAAGTVEQLGECFDTAERKTNVRVVMVYLKKVAADDSLDMWAKEGHERAEKEYHVEVGDDPNMIALRDNLGNMEQWFNMANEHFAKAASHLRRAQMYLTQNKITDHDHSSENRMDFGKIAAMALGNAQTARQEFLRRHRKLAWTSVFQQLEFDKILDSQQRKTFMRDVQRDATVPFTAANIRDTLHNVWTSRKKLFDESVSNVFDELCSHAVENCSGPVMPEKVRNGWRRGEGWKTNDSYKVNERLIFPYGVDYDKKFGGGFNTKYGSDADRMYEDLDRIICRLDGRDFAKCFTVGAALRGVFSSANPRRLKTAFSSVADQITESQYFEIRFFKKGTLHLKWKRLDLLEKFNIHAAAGKKWIGENTQQYRPPVRKEYADLDYRCRVDGCKYVNRVCTQCGGDDVDAILGDITCELCRAVFEATGETYCPMHPRPEAPVIEATPDPEPPQIPAPERLQLAAPVPTPTTPEPSPTIAPSAPTPPKPTTKTVDPARSEACRRAWDTIRANRAAKALAATV